MNLKNKIFTLENALIHGLVPKKEFENNVEFKYSELEQAVESPTFAPLPGAKQYNLTKDEVFYRESECEKTLTRKDLLKGGISAAKINGSTPYAIIPISKKQTEELFKPSSFPELVIEKKEKKANKTFLYKKGLFLGDFGNVKIFLNGPIEEMFYPYISDQTHFTTIVFVKNNIQLTVIVSYQIKEIDTDTTKQKIVSAIKKQLKSFLTTSAKTIEKTENEYINKFFKKMGYFYTFATELDDFSSNYLKAIEAEVEKQDQKNTLLSLLSNKPYHEHFPARKLKRNIIIYEAPTNSGKTYTACNEIKKTVSENENNKTVCVFPLRALAAQIKDEFMQEGYQCSLITGEEREIEVDAQIESITAEIMSVSKQYDLVFVDESQLIFDQSRGSAYARAIIGAYTETLILAVAPAYKNALVHWIKTVLPDDTIEERILNRLCPLNQIQKTIQKNNVEKGDIIVAFSAKEIHRIAAELSKEHKVGVIYGKMSPSARRAMVRDFMEEGFDVLIATDAIGMGISIPAKRVLFSALDKYDGDVRRFLSNEEIRQIAGRAGRFGFYDEGFYGTYELKNCDFHIQKAVSMILPEPIPKKLTISPDKHIFMSALNLTLQETIRIWKNAASSDYYAINERVLEDLSNKAAFLDVHNIDKQKLIDLLFVTFAEDRFEEYTLHTVNLINGNQLKNHKSSAKPGSIAYYEDYAQYLTLSSQLQRIFPELCPSENEIRNLIDECGENMTALLKKMYG